MPHDAAFDLQQFLPYLLNQAAEASSLEFARVYKDRYGLLRTDWRVLFHVGQFGPITAREIGRRATIHKTKISRAVQRLEARRFLTRDKDAEDRRVEWLRLTKAGLAAYRDLRLIAERYEAALTADLTTEEVAALRRALRVLSRPRG